MKCHPEEGGARRRNCIIIHYAPILRFAQDDNRINRALVKKKESVILRRAEPDEGTA
jgi:hypothetical protein